MRYKFVLGFLFLVLFSILVSAFVFAAQESDEFKAEVQTVVNDIYPTQTAKFLVMITNPTKQDDDFKLDFGLVPKWSFATDPSSYLSSVDVDAGESVSFPVLIKASGDGMTYGMQAFTLTIKSVKTGLSKEYPLQLLLRNPTPPLKDYLPAVSITIDFPDEVDPRDALPMKVVLANKNSLKLDEVSVSITSKLFDVSRIISLGSLETKIEKFDIKYNPATPPTDDQFTVKAVVGDSEAGVATKQVKIKTVSDVSVKEDVTKKFFKKTSDFTYTNVGNVAYKKSVQIETSLLAMLFTQTSPKAKLASNEQGRFYTWEFELAPKESVTVSVIKNYRALIYVFLLLVLGVVAYFIFRSPILVMKETEVLKIEEDKMSHEGVSHMKVLIHLKNRSNKPVDEVKLIDRVPQIVAVDQDFAVGQLHPDKIIRHEHKGTFIKWNISSLDPFEERIICYNIVSKLKIIGGLTLPSAIVKFKGRGKMPRKIFSNKVTGG